jgi:MGT family glycosyltransferase
MFDMFRGKYLMAKITYVGLPAHGHTNPILPIMNQLVEHGHHVLFYNSEEFREKVESTGVDFRPYDYDVPSTQDVSKRMTGMIQASLFFIELSYPLTTFMITEIERERPDLIIYDSTCMWGYICARKHNIPSVCTITHFVLDGLMRYLGMSVLSRYILTTIPHLPKIIRWRKQMNQSFGRDAGGITEYADLNIVFTSEDFHPPNTFIDTRFKFVGASIDAREGSFPFEALTTSTIIYISLGTINHLNLDFYHKVFEAYEECPAQFILSVGHHTDIETLGDIPKNFIVRNFVPQLEILQRATVFITHGGMNSVHEGLYYGVPEVVIPQQMEQYVNGKRVADVGTGVLLGTQYPYGQVTIAELRSALDTVLSDPSYIENARHYGQTLKTAGGFKQAVHLIEECLSINLHQRL